MNRGVIIVLKILSAVTESIEFLSRQGDVLFSIIIIIISSFSTLCLAVVIADLYADRRVITNDHGLTAFTVFPSELQYFPQNPGSFQQRSLLKHSHYYHYYYHKCYMV